MTSSHKSSQSLALKAAELAFAAPQVVAHRLTRMALAGSNPTPRDRTEFARMGSEKASAFAQSWNAMLMQAALTNWELAVTLSRALWFPWLGARVTTGTLTNQLQRASLQLMHKGLAPVHSAATANARRLGRARVRTR